MKKRKIFLSIVLILLFCAAIAAWLLFAPATKFNAKSQFVFVRENQNTKEQVLNQLSENNIIRSRGIFSFLSERLNVWSRVKSGRFEIKKGESIFDILRTFRNNTQSPVRLVINKFRTREDFARLIGKNFSVDSLTAISYLNSNDSLQQFDVDTNTVMTLIIPDTYFLNWSTTINRILSKLKSSQENFWDKKDRRQRAEALGLSPLQVYIMASIIEEETNKNDEKDDIASVYINRLNSNMSLSADPTVKFALRDFGIKRIMYGHLAVNSPYNTYRNKGLPPGPICTPSQATIDAVLNAPKTDYLFFVARNDGSGYHHFSNNFAEHRQYAKQYQKRLDTLFYKIQFKQNSR